MRTVDTDCSSTAGLDLFVPASGVNSQGCLLRIHPVDLNTGLINFDSPQFMIGREESCNLTINQDAVSRQHCQFEKNSEGVFLLTDLGSTNGTYVNGNRLGAAPYPVYPSDTIRLGGQVYKFLTTDHIEAHHYDATYSMMTTDSLTGVANKRYFIDTLNREICRCVRSRNSLSILMLDVDHFKNINDTHGHLVGDDVLREFALRLTGELRDGDMIARYGGEEFVIMASEADANQARSIAERCLAVIGGTPFKTSAGDIDCTVSIGGETFFGTPIDITPKKLIGKADQKLYQAKKLGRNRYAD